MAQQFNSLPNFTVPLQDKGITSKDWFFYWANLFTGLAPAAEVPVVPGASPYTYSPAVKGTLIVSGGTVSLIRFSRDGTNFYATGQIAGMLPMNARDQLVITYTVTPTVTFVPT